MKECSICGVPKSLESFYRDSSRKDGLEGRCKVCSNRKRTAFEQRRNTIAL
jgi:hypothetical protein